MTIRRHLPSALVVTAVLVACSRKGADDETSSGGPNAGSFDKAALLRAFGDCAVTTYKEFQTAASRFDGATQKLKAEGTPDALASARSAWSDAMDVWERAEVMQFGPAAMAGPGAADMRDGIYAWPLVGRCLIDGQIVDKTYETNLAGALASTRGLGAAEYLLFYAGTENGCGTAVTINANGTWAALGQELPARRYAYSAAIATDVNQRAQKLVEAWEPGKGDFLATLSQAPNATFSSQQMAFNAVSDAVYYVDDFVKTMKVGKPAALTPDCAANCSDLVESPWAKRSKAHLKNNLAGFEAIFRGCGAGGAGGAGLGFDDLLVAVGAQATSDKMVAALEASKAALAALTEPTLEEDIQKNPAGVKALFDALRNLFAIMKSEVATVLDLNPPQRVASDND